MFDQLQTRAQSHYSRQRNAVHPGSASERPRLDPVTRPAKARPTARVCLPVDLCYKPCPLHVIVHKHILLCINKVDVLLPAPLSLCVGSNDSHGDAGAFMALLYTPAALSEIFLLRSSRFLICWLFASLPSCCLFAAFLSLWYCS